MSTTFQWNLFASMSLRFTFMSVIYVATHTHVVHGVTFDIHGVTFYIHGVTFYSHGVTTCHLRVIYVATYTHVVTFYIHVNYSGLICNFSLNIVFEEVESGNYDESSCKGN